MRMNLILHYRSLNAMKTASIPPFPRTPSSMKLFSAFSVVNFTLMASFLGLALLNLANIGMLCRVENIHRELASNSSLHNRG